jgi:hypothetical protein
LDGHRPQAWQARRGERTKFGFIATKPSATRRGLMKPARLFRLGEWGSETLGRPLSSKLDGNSAIHAVRREVQLDGAGSAVKQPISQ